MNTSIGLLSTLVDTEGLIPSTRNTTGYLSLDEVAKRCQKHATNIRFAINAGKPERVDSSRTKGAQIFITKQAADIFNKM